MQAVIALNMVLWSYPVWFVGGFVGFQAYGLGGNIENI